MSGVNDMRKVRAGEPLVIPAAAYNAFIDTALAGRRVRADQNGQSAVAEYDPAVVQIKNGTGGDVGRFSVLTIDDILIDPADNADGFKERVGLVGAIPSATGDQVAITLEPIADGEIGWAVVSGVVPVQLDVQDAGDTAAAPTLGDETILTTGAGGAIQILWKETGTGTKWGLVRLGSIAPKMFPVKLTQSGGSNGNKTTAPTYTYDVYEFTATVDRTPTAGPQIGTAVTPFLTRPSGKVVAATYGTAFLASDGGVILYQAFERPTTGGC